MNINNKNKEVFFQWEASSRYFEKKPKSYFRAIIVLSILISLILFFIKEPILIGLVWVIFFVVYAKATVPPLTVRYSLDKFGFGYIGGYLSYPQIILFSVENKSNGSFLRIITNEAGREVNIGLPQNSQKQTEIIGFLKNKVPFVEKLPKTETEKIADYLIKITGLG